ncbi:C40 family peptidase [Paenalcaligenes niemegkensis]|uniref:C40 family peptidase n=1 Tax=Paenalcaligenes niemegkensis TaxID=2895469 RepID=UPI001EE97D18|nr:C40 family peptidase [Paenalcaligenes niemegkensis]MCQ9618406.1 C40 family peptidase [Paenalcaligenes niemegkensis]
MRLAKAVMKAAREHAERMDPQESCGVIITTGGRRQYVACGNDANKPEQDFKINPRDWCIAEDAGEPVAIVHSHPGALPRPSMADRVEAEKHDLPWLILGRDESHEWLHPCGYVAPLIGRTFHHGILDCWTAVRDWYARELAIELPDFERDDLWWEKEDAQSLYAANYEAAGFTRVSEPQRGDILIMSIKTPGRPCFHPNHAAIYLGSDAELRSEEATPIFGAGPFIFHHMYGRLSTREIYGFSWAQKVELILRHKTKRG